MADEENTPQPPESNRPQPPRAPAKPSAKTSSVPLKKETVRITLKSNPGQGAEGGGTAPPPRPPARPGAPTPPSGSKTIPLTPPQGGARPGAPVGKQTVKLQTPPTGGASLPKATVPLQRTAPVSSAPPTAAVGGARVATAAFDDEEEEEPAGLAPLSIAVLALALILLIVQMAGSDRIPFFVQTGGSPTWAVPENVRPGWEQQRQDGSWYSTFDSRIKEIPDRTD